MSLFMNLKNEDYVTVYTVWLIIICSLLVLAENPGMIILVKLLSYHVVIIDGLIHWMVQQSSSVV